MRWLAAKRQHLTVGVALWYLICALLLSARYDRGGDPGGFVWCGGVCVLLLLVVWLRARRRR